MKNITLKKALATPCKCGGMPKLGDPDGLWILICQKCGEESMRGCRRHYATNSWWAMNKGAKLGMRTANKGERNVDRNYVKAYHKKNGAK